MDDGGSLVPAGIEGTVERVVVVGAGIAGLTVANALRHGGVECVVLEARDRIGGRLDTLDLAGSPVDMGASWIHHPAGNPLRAFAEQAGISCAPGNPLSTLGGFDCAEGRRLTPDEVESSLALQFEAFPDAVHSLRSRLGARASAHDAIDCFVAEAGLSAVDARRARQALRAVIEADAADLTEHQSLRWLWNETEYGGDYFGDLPSGGYRTVVEALASGLDVRLGVAVDEVLISPSGVLVQGSDGATEKCSHVVVTVPLGVLKAGLPAFSPALPADRVTAIDRLGFGRYEKVALRFDEPFWRAAGLSHMLLFPRDPVETAVWVFDLDAFGAGPTLVAHLFHSVADHVLEGAPDHPVSWVLDMIGAACDGSCPAPVAQAVSTWARDEHSRGAYTHVRPGADPADADLLGQPVNGRLLFAGEHTQSARLGYADGAMTSGIREARRLLSRPTAHLGPVVATFDNSL